MLPLPLYVLDRVLLVPRMPVASREMKCLIVCPLVLDSRRHAVRSRLLQALRRHALDSLVIKLPSARANTLLALPCNYVLPIPNLW